MKKKLPTLKSDAEAEAFVANADLAEYDLSGLVPMRFELKRKDKAVNLRLPEQLLDAVRDRATRIGIPYQRFIRMALEKAVREPKRRAGSSHQ
ncbi:MAG: BrnA antitoxin family protein [Methylocystis sp.]|nr:BrnA antitoxin family protein [Methylocystis sp.]